MESNFEAGDPVEVRSADGSAWYEARVVRAFSLSRCYVVDYDNGAAAESVHAARVRPRPGHAGASGLGLYQRVEALAGGGWRPGVVFNIHAAAAELRYDVCFPEKREEVEFGSREVRPQLEWVDGKWVSVEKINRKTPCKIVPKKGPRTKSRRSKVARAPLRTFEDTPNYKSLQGITETLYSKGTLVEVASVSTKLPIAWYPAIVIKVVDENILVVEYETLRTEDSSLKEIVASQYVRPYPPRASNGEKFDLLDEVEAFYGNGWWPGVVAKVNIGSRYNIKFLHWEEEIEFAHSDLRLLYDWIDGQWVQGQASQDKSMKSHHFGRKISDGHLQLLHASSSPHNCNVPVLITSSSSDADEVPCQLSTGPTNVETKNAGILTYQSKLEPPCKKKKNGETIEDNTRLLDFLVIPRGTNTSSGVSTGLEVSMPVIEMEPNFRIKALVEKCSSTSPPKKINVVSQVTVTKTSSNILIEDTNDESHIPEKLSEKLSLLRAPASILGLVDKTEGLVKTGTKFSGDKDFLRDSEWELNKGRRSPMVNGEQGSMLIYKQHGVKGVRHLTVGEKRRKKSIPRKLTIIEPPLEGGSMRHRHIQVLGHEPPSEGLSTSHAEAITRRGTLVNGLGAQDLLNSQIGSRDASLVETTLSGVQFSETGSETQNEVPNTTEQLVKGSTSEKARNTPIPSVCKSPRDKSPLPFEKRSTMWEVIESKEVFSRMPQRPHFRPLDQHCKELREGLALGLMVTFSNSVDNVGQLQITDPRIKFDESLKVLMHLEAHGFDVESIRARITELLRRKDNLEQVIAKRSELKATLTERQRGRDQLNVQIESVGKFVMDFEQSFSKIQDLRTSLVKQRSENSEVAKLQADLRTVEDALLSTEFNFEATLSADWQTL